VSLTAYAEPIDELTYEALSESQKKVVGVVKENVELYEEAGATLKHGIIAVGAWGQVKARYYVQ